jgi:hypothetical protein
MFSTSREDIRVYGFFFERLGGEGWAASGAGGDRSHP